MSATEKLEKLALPAFLRLFTSVDVAMPKAMAIAKKIYAKYNTPQDLGRLTDAALKNAGVETKEERKIILNAVKKAGFKNANANGIASSEASSSKSSRAALATTPKKRKRDHDLERPSPDNTREELEGAEFGSFEFGEVLDEEVLKSKATVVNRAPVMTAWATVVAERMGFKREEALSIASAYTEMNAISKGVSLGVFKPEKGKGIELVEGQSQPYVDVMGRRPLYSTRMSQWRALLKGEPVSPASAFAYMQRSFRQTLPYVVGAMRLLAESYSPGELNRAGFSLYADFRPEVTDWGGRSEMRCERILGLQKKSQVKKMEEREEGTEGTSVEGEGQSITVPPVHTSEPSAKRLKGETLDEYEDAFDDEIDFDDPSLQGL